MKAAIPTRVLAVKPAHITPVRPMSREPAHANGTNNPNVRTAMKKMEGYGLFNPLYTDVLNMTNPWNP